MVRALEGVATRGDEGGRVVQDVGVALKGQALAGAQDVACSLYTSYPAEQKKRL